MKTGGWLGIAAAIATGLGFLGTYVDAWPRFGWNTPNSHNADVESVRADLEGKVDRLTRLLLCEKAEQRLRDLMRDQQAGDDSVELVREIEKVRAAMKRLDCAEFDAY